MSWIYSLLEICFQLIYCLLSCSSPSCQSSSIKFTTKFSGHIGLAHKHLLWVLSAMVNKTLLSTNMDHDWFLKSICFAWRSSVMMNENITQSEQDYHPLYNISYINHVCFAHWCSHKTATIIQAHFCEKDNLVLLYNKQLAGFTHAPMMHKSDTTCL